MTRKSNQLQNHPKFITVNGKRLSDQATQSPNKGQWIKDYSAIESSAVATGSPLLFHHFSEIFSPSM